MTNFCSEESSEESQQKKVTESPIEKYKRAISPKVPPKEQISVRKAALESFSKLTEPPKKLISPKIEVQRSLYEKPVKSKKIENKITNLIKAFDGLGKSAKKEEKKSSGLKDKDIVDMYALKNRDTAEIKKSAKKEEKKSSGLKDKDIVDMYALKNRDTAEINVETAVKNTEVSSILTNEEILKNKGNTKELAKVLSKQITKSNIMNSKYLSQNFYMMKEMQKEEIEKYVKGSEESEEK
ncbi:hypothetical protein NUSPORA_02614 [Nucleospora cyclopteri]